MDSGPGIHYEPFSPSACLYGPRRRQNVATTRIADARPTHLRIRLLVETRHVRAGVAVPAPAHPSRHHVLEVPPRDGTGTVARIVITLSAAAAGAIVVREAGPQIVDLERERDALVHVARGVFGSRVQVVYRMLVESSLLCTLQDVW